MTERHDAIVIGAGHNGLVCAAYLARSGMSVLCLEAADQAGGMMAPRAFAGDYQVPGLAHVAHPLSAEIRRDLGLDQEGYSHSAIGTVALDAAGDHVFIDGQGLSGNGLAEADSRAYVDFRNRFLDFAKALKPLFENRPPRVKDMDFADRKTLAKLGWKLRFGLGRDSMYEFLRVAAINIYDVLDEAFEDDRLKAALATDAVLGSGMGPRTPGTVLTWLQRLYGELNGPPGMLAGRESNLAALTAGVEASGVSIRCNAAVERILIEDGRAIGVRLADGEEIRSDIVVSGADPRATLLQLVGAPQLDAMFANRVAQIRGAGVVARLHLALRGQPEFTGLDSSKHENRLLIAPSMKHIERAFNHAKYGECSQEPVFEITIPSLVDEKLAPAGGHVMSVNVAYVPYALDGGWDDERKEQFARRCIASLNGYVPGLESMVAGFELLTPQDIETQYRAVEGHWHHGEMTIHQSFMMRPVYGAAQYDTPIDDLFLCSAGCHPGGGITGLPGRNAARRIIELRGEG